MATTATLESPEVRLDAGGEAVVPLTIRNTGTLVEGYRIEVVGVPAAWTTVEPTEVSLYPGDSTTAVLTVRPPRVSSTPAGRLPFGVRVIPTERPNEAVVPEGAVEVLPFLETTAELIPRTSHAKKSAKHQVAVDNRGNAPVTVIFDAGDPAQNLDVEVLSQGFTVNPGNAAFTDVRVKAAKRLWRGAPITHPFVVNVVPHDGPPVKLDGAYVQEATFPKWLWKALLALLLIALLLLALWFLVLKPTIKSAAKDAVKPALSSASKQAASAGAAAADAQKKAAAAQAQVKSLQSQVNQPTKTGGSGTGTGTGTPTPPVVTNPYEQRLSVQTSTGQTNQQVVFVPAKQKLNITDIDFENPNGDFGRVTLTSGAGPNQRVLKVLGLDTLRDNDYHYVSPIVIPAGSDVTFTVTCGRPGRPVALPRPTQCNNAVSLVGTLVKTGS